MNIHTFDAERGHIAHHEGHALIIYNDAQETVLSCQSCKEAILVFTDTADGEDSINGFKVAS